jgi:hypothetical protein
MERSRTALVLNCRVATVLEEESYDIDMSVLGRGMERSQPALVLGCCVGAMFDE